MPEDYDATRQATRQAETDLLASLLLEGSVTGSPAVREVGKMVNSTDFMDYRKGDLGQRSRIYEAIMSSPHADQITVAQTMHEKGTLKDGDVAYMAEIISDVPTSIDYLWYARAVVNYSVERQIKYYTSKGDMKKVRELSQRGMKKKLGGVEL